MKSNSFHQEAGGFCWGINCWAFQYVSPFPSWFKAYILLQDVSPHGYKKEKNCNTNQKPNSLDPQCNLELSGVVAFHTHFGSFVLIKVLIRSSSLICEEYLSSNASMNSTIQFYPKIASLKLHYNFKRLFKMQI